MRLVATIAILMILSTPAAGAASPFRQLCVSERGVGVDECSGGDPVVIDVPSDPTDWGEEWDPRDVVCALRDMPFRCP